MLPPQVPGQLPQMSSPYPGAQVYMPMQPHMSVGPVGQNLPMAYYQMGPVYPPGSTVMVEGGFDAGARFTGGTSVSIPVSNCLALFMQMRGGFEFAVKKKLQTKSQKCVANYLGNQICEFVLASEACGCITTRQWSVTTGQKLVNKRIEIRKSLIDEYNFIHIGNLL